MNFYHYVLQGHEATEENAILAANSLDWQEIEISGDSISFIRYFDTVNGIDIYYCYGSDCYYFAESEN